MKIIAVSIFFIALAAFGVLSMCIMAFPRRLILKEKFLNHSVFLHYSEIFFREPKYWVRLKKGNALTPLAIRLAYSVWFSLSLLITSTLFILIYL